MMTCAEEIRALLAIYASDQVARVLEVWRTSGVRVDAPSAIGLRRAIQVEVLDIAQNQLGIPFDDAFRLTELVAVGGRRHREETDHRPELRACMRWEFTANGDDLDGEWERLDREVS